MTAKHNFCLSQMKKQASQDFDTNKETIMCATPIDYDGFQMMDGSPHSVESNLNEAMDRIRRSGSMDSLPQIPQKRVSNPLDDVEANDLEALIVALHANLDEQDFLSEDEDDEEERKEEENEVHHAKGSTAPEAIKDAPPTPAVRRKSRSSQRMLASSSTDPAPKQAQRTASPVKGRRPKLQKPPSTELCLS